MSEPLKVSDGSQPYKFVVALVLLVLLVVGYLDLRGLLSEKGNLGFSQSTSLTTTSTIQVIGTSSTLITATSTASHFICNLGINTAWVAFANSVSTTTKPASSDSNGIEFATGTAATTCQGPFDFIGVHAAHTKIGTTTLQFTSFP